MGVFKLADCVSTYFRSVSSLKVACRLAMAMGAVAFVEGAAQAGCNSGNAADSSVLSSANCQASATVTEGTAVGRAAFAGTTATAYGFEARAEQERSLAIGARARALGVDTLAIGTRSSALGVDSLAIGHRSSSLGASSMTIGSLANSNGSAEVAIGGFARTQGGNATAIGYLASAKESGAAFGYNSISGAQSVAVGYGATARSAYSIVVGTGAGVTESADGVIRLGAFAGTQSTGGRYSTVIGSSANEGISAQASGAHAIAIGGSDSASVKGATASGPRSIAIGLGSVAKVGDGVAIGYTSLAAAVQSIAIGKGAEALHARSIALGEGSTSSGADTVSVGSSARQRRIVNVAPGVAATDAVNLAQVRALIKGGTRAASRGQVQPRAAAVSAGQARESLSVGAPGPAGGSARAAVEEDAELSDEVSPVPGWANVAHDGTLRAARNILNSSRLQTGKYVVAFRKASLAQCALNGTLAQAGFLAVRMAQEANTVEIETLNRYGVPADLGFHLIAVC